jgi:hypothetical protein
MFIPAAAWSAWLDGTVLDAATGLPLAGARVIVVDHPLLHVETGADGRFHIRRSRSTTSTSTTSATPRWCR